MKRVIIIIIHNVLAGLILAALWLLSFLGSEYWKILPTSELAPILMICIAFLSFLVINWRLFQNRPFPLRLVMTVFNSSVATSLWHPASTILITMVTIRLSRPPELFLKKVEPLTITLSKLDNSAMAGLIFALIYFMAVAGVWYWVLFMGGAQKWRESIIQSNRNLAPVDSEGFLVRPMVLKIFITLMFLSGIFAVYLGVREIISR